MNLPESQDRIRNLIGRGQRLNVDIDEVRNHSPKLARYMQKKPIDAIKMFEDNLNESVKKAMGDGKTNNEKLA